jgi:nucleotide-binding universal stress UspA family protein
MYERMLVPLDGSELAEVALPYVKELAIHLGSEVILVNVRAPAENPDEPEHRVYISKMATKTEQEIIKSPHLPSGYKVKVDSVIIGSPGLLAHPAEEIVDYAEKENVSLIVMATHGRTGISRWALGSVANKVARASKCPVLLIRANADVKKNVYLDKIMVPLDGSKQSETVLPYVETLAAKLRARVILLHVVVQPYKVYAGSEGVVEVPYTEEEIKSLKAGAEEYLQKVSNKIMDTGVTAIFEVRVGSAGEEIIRAEGETGVDIVAMSTHGHSGFSHWGYGSITDKVLHAGNKPLLVVRPHQP